MKQWQQDVINAVQMLEPYAIDICSELVRTNTVNPYAGGLTGNETAGQKIVDRELTAMGFSTTMFEPPKGLHEKVGIIAPKDRSYEGRMNLVGRLTMKQPGKTIVMNGHMDTVGIQEMTIEPFAGELKDNRIWGRGACDCKGSLTGGLVALKALIQTGVLSKGTIIFESVIEEECSGGGAGTMACCLAGYNGDACILLDGSVEFIAFECLGVMTGTITVMGQGGHAIQRDAVSALDMACLVKEELDNFKQAHLAIHDKTSFCIGEFQAGEAPWSIPRMAIMRFNISYTFEQATNAEAERGQFNGILVREEVEQALQASCAKHPWLKAHPPSLEWIKDLIPHRTNPDESVVQEVARAYTLVTGKQAPLAIQSGWQDAAWLSRLGKMPTVSFGSGRHGSPHSVDESVPVDDILTQAKVVALAVAGLTQSS